MSEIHPRIEMPVLDWSDDGVSGLVPTGTVTLLLADVDPVKVDPIDLRMSSDHMDMHHSELLAAHTAANGAIEEAQAGGSGHRQPRCKQN